MGYRQFFQKLPIPWLVGRANGQKYWGALGDTLDDQVQRLIEAVQARFPSKGPSDALPFKASERRIYQGLGETEAAFRERLRNAWTAWTHASQAGGMLAQLYQDGYTNAYLVTQNGLYYTLTGPDPIASLTIGTEPTLIAALTSDSNPSATPIPAGTPWWMFDSNIQCCSRFALLLPTQPTGWTAGVPDANTLANLKRTIGLWRPGKATCMGVYATVSGKQWGYPFTQTWGAGTGNYGGSALIYNVDLS